MKKYVITRKYITVHDITSKSFVPQYLRDETNFYLNSISLIVHVKIEISRNTNIHA